MKASRSFQNSRSTICSSVVKAGLIVVAAATSSLPAQQPAYAPPPQEQSFGRSVSSFFKRVFYGDPQGQYYNPAARGRGYSLDAPPVRSNSHHFPGSQAAASRPPSYASASASAGTATGKPAPVTKTKKSPEEAPPAPKPSSATSEKRYSPPKISADIDQPKKTESKPSVASSSQKPADDLKLPAWSNPQKSETLTAGTEPTSTSTSTSEAKLKDTFPLPGQEPEETATNSTKSPAPDTSGSTGSSDSTSFPVGKKSSKAGRVISPFPPYNELDVTDLPSGSLALDPTTQKVFQVP